MPLQDHPDTTLGGMRPFSPTWFREERAKAATRWHVWPLTVFLALVGAGGLVRFIYKGWWLQVLFMLAWLGLLWVIGGSSRIAWKQRRANRQ